MTDFKNSLPKALLKGLIVILLALIPMVVMNIAMENFLDAELEAVQIAAEKTLAAKKALEEAQDQYEKARLEAELAVKKAEQYEEFYQKYKNRESYHYYGQFYEMYENMYSADTIIIGTSHAAHGINPLYLEEEIPDRSFYNFALNGSNPGYYVDWFKLFEKAEYPQPKTVIFCVDWFMFDSGWLWRRIDFDTNPDCPANIMEKIKAREYLSSTEITETEEEETAETEALEAIQPEQIEVEEKKKITSLDDLTTELFSHIAIIYSRDRIPEMLKYYLTGASFTAAVDDSVGTVTENEELPEIPVYEHEFLSDSIGNITSDFYKGYIPWESYYDGSFSVAQAHSYDDQIASMYKLMAMFEDWGCEVIFVEIPEYIKGRRAVKGEENNELLSKIAEKYGVTFFNYNTDLASEINDDYTNYSDWGHMSKKGSTAFSQKLAQDLKAYWGE